jgi:two-component system sensor histidine kinase CiaH
MNWRGLRWLSLRATTPGNAPAADARLLSRTRRRLILWSGGSTLILLTILSSLLYWAVAEKLRSESIDQLSQRATSLQKAVLTMQMPSPPIPERTFSVKVTDDPGTPGFVFGGATSGTLGVVFATDPSNGLLPSKIGSLDPNSVLIGSREALEAAARDGTTTVEEADVRGIPVRVLTTAVEVGANQFVVQAIGDRTVEIRTLQALLVVLVVGGLAVVAGAVGVGYVYAGRALVPIRESLRRQREFAADASHELRTPLAIVSTALDHLRRNRTDPAAIDRAAEDIEAGSRRLTSLVDDLLLLARADADAVELVRGPQDLGELSADALADFATLAEERGLRLRLDIEPAPVIGDADRLRQLVGILIDNAIRHTPGGGSVTVRVRPGAELSIDDDGPGIRPDDLPNLFRRFWRAADAPAGGTGLGLAIAEWIARSHGGRIRAANRPEGGARFEVVMPAA